MRKMLETAIRIATAPLRLFGRSRRFRIGLGAGGIVAGFFAATLWALDRYLPADSGAGPALANLPPLPPLQPVTKSSYVIAPVAVALTGIAFDSSRLRAIAEADGTAKVAVSGLPKM